MHSWILKTAYSNILLMKQALTRVPQAHANMSDTVTVAMGLWRVPNIFMEPSAIIFFARGPAF
jgi:hypothetical protein